MKARPIAARFSRVVTNAFNRTDTGPSEPEAEAEARGINYPPIPEKTSPADAWKIMREHRANVVAALAAGLFVSRIR